ncbi:hypothetical protein KP509_05G085800 [Ceratopteris richardii]|uniref:Uncharacterized protein n=1 Tax=Ceratopteris richardii TaxID=49495 RepID=A0A8T2UQU3_CERRI|nr:hypothetical protein KP509_05G085800 [Ceratopteris richardii]
MHCYASFGVIFFLLCHYLIPMQIPCEVTNLFTWLKCEQYRTFQ